MEEVSNGKKTFFLKNFSKKFAFFQKTFSSIQSKGNILICVLITFSSFSAFFSSGLLLAFAVPKYTFVFPLFESTRDMVAEDATIHFFRVLFLFQMLKSLPLTVYHFLFLSQPQMKAYALKWMVVPFLPYLSEFFPRKTGYCASSCPITTPGTVRIALFAALSSECPKSFVYDVL